MQTRAAQYTTHNYSAGICLVMATYTCWRWVRAFQAAYAKRQVQWESDQWWWKQCTDMQFYEKMQEHMDICDRLEVIPSSSLPWRAAQDTVVDFLDAPWELAAMLLSLLVSLVGMRCLGAGGGGLGGGLGEGLGGGLGARGLGVRALGRGGDWHSGIPRTRVTV